MTPPTNIRPKDLQRVTGLCYAQCLRIAKSIRFVCNKKKHQYITAQEAADYLGLPLVNFILLLENHPKPSVIC
jgi:hypothetical protein